MSFIAQNTNAPIPFFFHSSNLLRHQNLQFFEWKVEPSDRCLLPSETLHSVRSLFYINYSWIKYCKCTSKYTLQIASGLLNLITVFSLKHFMNGILSQLSYSLFSENRARIWASFVFCLIAMFWKFFFRFDGLQQMCLIEKITGSNKGWIAGTQTYGISSGATALVAIEKRRSTFYLEMQKLSEMIVKLSNVRRINCCDKCSTTGMK